MVKESAVAWRALTEHEKQAFRDEHEELREDYVKRREAYWSSVDPAIVREINKQRKAKGIQRIRAKKPAEEKRPLTAYIRFAHHYDSSSTNANMSTASL
jgi:hypothetical protein